MVEQLTLNQWVQGSSPCASTTNKETTVWWFFICVAHGTVFCCSGVIWYNIRMKKLHLVLAGRWYDKIAQGDKTSEYRECKPYWNDRLGRVARDIDSGVRYSVVFHRGYTACTMEFVIDSVAVTTAKNDLNLQRVWEIKLGMRVK